MTHNICNMIEQTLYGSGPQPPGHGPVPVHGSFGTGPQKERINALFSFCYTDNHTLKLVLF